MHKHAGAENWQSLFIPFRCLQQETFRVQFSNVICTKMKPCTTLLYLLYKNKSL